MVIIITILLILHFTRKSDYEMLEQSKTFPMKKLKNKPLYKLNNMIVRDKKEIYFDNDDNDDLIPVNQKTSCFICIGNNSRHKQKIQFTVRNDSDVDHGAEWDKTREQHWKNRQNIQA